MLYVRVAPIEPTSRIEGTHEAQGLVLSTRTSFSNGNVSVSKGAHTLDCFEGVVDALFFPQLESGFLRDCKGACRITELTHCPKLVIKMEIVRETAQTYLMSIFQTDNRNLSIRI